MAKVDFFANGLCLVCHVAQTELMDLKQFHWQSENAWKKQDEKLQDKLNKILSEYPSEHHYDIMGSHGWELHLNQMKFPGIHRESMLITIFNFLESELNEVCRIVSESIESPLKLRHLQGKGIERALLYLAKVANFDFSAFSPELPYLKNVNLLRNVVVHNAGRLPENAGSKLSIYIEENPYLKRGPGDNVSLSAEFIDEFIDNLESFFAKLEAEVNLFMERVSA